MPESNYVIASKAISEIRQKIDEMLVILLSLDDYIKSTSPPNKDTITGQTSGR